MQSLFSRGCTCSWGQRREGGVSALRPGSPPTPLIQSCSSNLSRLLLFSPAPHIESNTSFTSESYRNMALTSSPVVQTVRETSAQFGNARALPQAPRLHRFLTCHCKISSRVISALHLICSALHKTSAQSVSQCYFSLISKTSRREERGVIRHRQYRKHSLDFIQVIVHSIYLSNQSISMLLFLNTINVYLPK